MITVRELLIEGGLGQRTTWPEFALAAELADAIADKACDPLKRAKFIATAALDLKDVDPEKLTPYTELMRYLRDQAVAQHYTPYGPQELWGTLMQHLALEEEPPQW